MRRSAQSGVCNSGLFLDLKSLEEVQIFAKNANFFCGKAQKH